MSGTFFIVGIGPGDPELITVKAARVLQSVSHVFVPVSGEGRESVAYDIARKHIPSGTVTSELVFPMVKDEGVLQRHYRCNQQAILAVVGQGHDVALITLGDPSTYSTSWPILLLMQEQAPDVRIEVIPGVTSYAQAAARAQLRLGEGNEILCVVSAYDSPERISACIDTADTVVFLKTYAHRKELIELLRARQVLGSCTYIHRSGLDGEQIVRDMHQVPEQLDYMSMIILEKH